MRWFRKRAADASVADLLDRCLTRIERGEATVESCLAAYPEQAAELRPLLMTARAVHAVEAAGPSASARARMRARVLAATAPRPMPLRRRPLWQPVAAAGMALALLAVLAVPLTALQSGNAVPGDWNYGLKRAGERVRLAVTVDDADRRSVHLALAERREREIQTLLRRNRTEHLPAAIRDLQGENANVLGSLSGEAISVREERRIAEMTERQERVLEQVVRQAPQEVAAVAQEARVTVNETRSAAQEAAVRREPAPTPTRTPSPAPPALAQNQRSTEPTPAPTPTAVPSPSPSASPVASASPSPGATASPEASTSPSPSPSVSPSPSAVPVPTGPSAPLPPPSSAITTPTPTPAPIATPLPTPSATVPPPVTPSPLNTPAPVAPATPGPIIPGPITPVPTMPAPGRAAPTPARTPLSTPSPSPSPSSIGSRTVPAPGVTLVPGIARTFIYDGPDQALLVLLEPAKDKYEYVQFRAPNGGRLVMYRPGDPGGHNLIVPSGSEIVISVTDTVRLVW